MDAKRVTFRKKFAEELLLVVLNCSEKFGECRIKLV